MLKLMFSCYAVGIIYFLILRIYIYMLLCIVKLWRMNNLQKHKHFMHNPFLE